jgi:hypothetical protein
MPSRAWVAAVADPSLFPTEVPNTFRAAAQRGRGRVATPGEILAVERLFAQSLDFELSVPGNHYSGLTNEELFEILARQGRDFAKNNRTLRAHVLAELRIILEDSKRIPTNAQLERLSSAIIVDWVVKRMDGKVRDITVRRLTDAYARAKFAAGYREPIGKRTNWLRNAVAEAKVEFKQ